MLYSSLLPHKYKPIGWCLLIPATIAGILLAANDFNGLGWNARVFAFFDEGTLGKRHSFMFIRTDITSTLVGIVFIAGGLLVGFSKEKNEDEFISKLRLSSLLWAVLTNYLILIFCFAFIYGTSFVNVMLYNMFTVLIIFIARFNYVLYRNLKTTPDEKHA